MVGVRAGLVIATLTLTSACGAGSSPEVSPGAPSQATYVVSGRLQGVGGPAPGAPRPWPGTVTLTSSDGTSTTVHTDAHGHFTVVAPAGPGRYTLTGRSARFGSGTYPCRSADPVVLGGGTTRLRVDVLCQMK